MRVFMMNTAAGYAVSAEVWLCGSSGTSQSHENGTPGGADGTIWVYNGQATGPGGNGTGSWIDTGATWKGGAEKCRIERWFNH